MTEKWPQLEKQRRMPDSLRQETGQRLVELYKRGKSVRQLCQETGYSIGRVRRLMDEVGVEYRSRGGATGRRVQVASDSG